MVLIKYLLKVMDSWIYDGSPITHLSYEEKLKTLKEKVKANYLEGFIEKYMLNNNNCSLVIVKPNKGLAQRKAKKVEEKLAKYKATLSAKEIDELRERNRKLKETQLKENTKEEKATIPRLSLSEIVRKAETIPQLVKQENGITMLSHIQPTNKVAYINFLFDASVIEEEYIPYIGLLSEILGEMDTKEKSYLELNTEISRRTGGISFATDVYTEKNNIELYHPKFIVKTKVLSDRMEEIPVLVKELIASTSFEDLKRLKEIIQESKSKLKRFLTSEGNQIGMNRAASYYMPSNKYMDIIAGAMYYEFICDIEKNFENKASEIQSALKKVYGTIFNKNNLIVSYTGEEAYLDKMELCVEQITNMLHAEVLTAKLPSFKPVDMVEAIVSPSSVQYVVKSFNHNKLGYKYSGDMSLLKNIINSEYLYTRVRLQGGAYGCNMYISEDGNVALASYRDPNLIETVKTYDEIDQFINSIEYSAEELETFIIGAVGQLDRPLTPGNKGERAIRNYICKITNEGIQAEREQLLSATLTGIKAHAEMLKKGMEKNYCCVVGNEAKISENKNAFMVVTNLA
jgi:presequence protease